MYTSHSYNIIILNILLITKLINCDIGIRFTKQPEPIDAPFLDDVEFECILNIPSETVEWCHNDQVLNQQNNLDNESSDIDSNERNKGGGESKLSHSLIIPFNNISQIGNYQCIAWFGASAMISIPAKLSLADMKPFNKTIPDEYYDINIGNDIIINCPYPESKPQAYIQYYKNKKLITNPNILQTSNSLLIKNLTMADSGAYNCMASNSMTGQEYESYNKIELNIINTYLHKSPYFLKPPSKKYYVELGYNITLECNAIGNPKPNIYWSKSNEFELNNRTIQENGILTIINTQLSDAGIYICKSDNGISPTLNYNIELEVQELPRLIKEPETNTVNENEPIEFECIFNGTPEPTIEWYLNSKKLTNDNNVFINENKLKINMAEKKHAGIYQCFGSNVIGSSFGITMLRVSPIQTQIFSNGNDNIFDDIKMLNETYNNHHHNNHNHHNGEHNGKKHHKNKQHNGKNKHLKKNIIMVPPSRPNVTRLSDKSVMVRWNVPTNNGLPIQFFKVQYKEIGSNNKTMKKAGRWMTSNEDISSHIRSYEIDGLETNHTYRFRIAAVYSNNDNALSTNSAKFHLHKGSNANKNKPKPPSLTETEAISPNIIQIHWQYLNSVFSPVDGFYIYYRAQTSAGDYIKSTVEGQDVRTYNITYLQPDTPYEIKLQSFTVGAASDFSTILTRKTLIDPTVTTTTENNKEININNDINIQSGNNSKTVYYIVTGIIIFIIITMIILYILLNILKIKRKSDSNEDDSTTDNDKTDSLTIQQNITDSTTNISNGFINHNGIPSIIQNGNATNISNGILPKTTTSSKMNGKLSNGYINKSLVHSNNIINDDSDETMNMISTSTTHQPNHHHHQHLDKSNSINSGSNSIIYETKHGIPLQLQQPLNETVKTGTGSMIEMKQNSNRILTPPLRDNISQLQHNNINRLQQIHPDTNNISRDYNESLNMIQGIHDMHPGTREAINIINNPLLLDNIQNNDNNNVQYNIELNYLHNNNNNNNRNNNNNINNNRNRSKIDLDMEYELTNPINNNNEINNHHINNNSLRRKHKINNNNNNNKIINNNTKYSQNNNINNNNNWRGRSVVDTRRNENYM